MLGRARRLKRRGETRLCCRCPVFQQSDTPPCPTGSLQGELPAASAAPLVLETACSKAISSHALNLFRDPPSVTGIRSLTPSEICSSPCNVLLRARLRAMGAVLGQGLGLGTSIPVPRANNAVPSLVMLLSVVQNKTAKILSMLCNWLPRSSRITMLALVLSRLISVISNANGITPSAKSKGQM